MYHHRVGLCQQLVQLLAAVTVALNDFQVHVVGQGQRSPYGRLAATHDDDVLHILIMLLAHNLPDIGDILCRGHEVGQVAHAQLVETAGNDGLVAPLDGHHMIGVVGSAEVFQRLVEYLCRFAQLDTEQHQCAVMDIPPLPHPRQFQTADDVLSSEHFRIDERVDAQVLEERLIGLRQIFVVVDACHGLLGP